MRRFGGLICLLVLLQVLDVTSHTLYQWMVDSRTRFNYDPDRTNTLGVYNWPRTYSENCGGLQQSPVDIQTTLVRYNALCQCPRMIYASNMLKGVIKNNGHSPEFEPESPLSYVLTNVPHRPGTYYMNDFHLHYGGVRGRNFELQGQRFRGNGIMSAGSEHTLDGLRFEGELHFVFYNSKYRDLHEADDKADGVVVIVILVQKLPGTTSDSGETSRFSEFLHRNIPPISPYQMNYSTEVDMNMFFNRDCEFYTYTGSTTTPLCHESVRWIILREPIRVTELAWFELTGLVSRGDFNTRFGNYRTTQPLNERVIEANFMNTMGPVLPMPNGGVMMAMGNMSSANIPQMGGARNALVPGLNRNSPRPAMMVANMPDMSSVRNALVPRLDGNLRRTASGMRIPQNMVPTASIPPRNASLMQMAGGLNSRMMSSPMELLSPMMRQAMFQTRLMNGRTNWQTMWYSKIFNPRMRNTKLFSMLNRKPLDGLR